MGKFYASIIISSKQYKICRDDISQIYSKAKKITPIIPKYISIKKSMSSSTLCSS